MFFNFVLSINQTIVLRNLFFCTFYLFFSQTNITAQLTLTDSLQLAFNGATSDTARLTILQNTIPTAHFGQADKILELYKKGYEIALILHDIKGCLKCSKNIALVYMYGKSDEGTAFQWFQKALPYAEDIPDFQALSNLYYAMAIIHDHQTNRAKMFEAFLKAIDYIEQYPKFDVRAYQACMMAYESDKRFEDAIAIGKKGAEQAEKKNGDVFDKLILYNTLTQELKKTAKSQQTILFYQTKVVALLDSFDRGNDAPPNINTVAVLAGISYDNDRPDLVIRYANQAINITGDDNVTIESQAEAYSLLASVYEKQKNYPLSMECLRKSTTLSLRLRERNITEASAVKVGKLESERNLLQKQNEVDRQIWVSIFGFSIAALMLLGSIIAYRFFKREQERKQELATINATKDKLFSIIAHDLRAPIGTLKNYLELTDFGIMTQAQFATASQKLTNNVNALFQTLDNLLHWSYTQLKGIKSKPNCINLYELASEELRFLDGIAQHKNIEIVNNVDKKSIIFADRNQVGLVMRNIVSNSLKFTPSGGKIVLESENIKEGIISLKIIDTGIGMSQDIQNQLFTIQENTSRQGTSSEKGQGLGLILVKDMIESNKGTLHIESIENKGTTVLIQLPTSDLIEEK